MSFALSYMVSYYEGRRANISIVSVKMQAKCVVRDRSLFMWGGGGDFFCFSMKEKT